MLNLRAWRVNYLVGGSYTLEGGLLAGISVIQTVGAPLLSVQLVGNNAVVSWPESGSAGFVLEESNGLSPASWSAFYTTVTTSSGIKSVTVPAKSGIKVYRLRKP